VKYLHPIKVAKGISRGIGSFFRRSHFPVVGDAYWVASHRMLNESISVGTRTSNDERRKAYCLIAAIGLGRLLDADIDVEPILTFAKCGSHFRGMLAQTAILKGRLKSEWVHPPWDADMVSKLNGFQQNPFAHPFTCGNRDSAVHNGQESLLVATSNGWICPHCDYTQDWAWAWMAHPRPEWLVQTILNKQ